MKRKGKGERKNRKLLRESIKKTSTEKINDICMWPFLSLTKVSLYKIGLSPKLLCIFSNSPQVFFSVEMTMF